MVKIHTLEISPPLINTACAWASDLAQLKELYECPHTGAVTTRTAVLDGFKQDETHTVAFAKDSLTSINSYGYSPHPLSSYLSWIQSLLTSGPSPTKPIILSITSSHPPTLREMLTQIQAVRKTLSSPTHLAIELNTSCPNIVSSPPPAYNIASLRPLLDVLAETFWADTSLTIGLKLPPYLYEAQFRDVLSCLEGYTKDARNPFAFLTCTNTLGNSLLFADQVLDSAPSSSTDTFALPSRTGHGGLGGEAIHALSLGNVRTFSGLLSPSTSAPTYPGLANVKIFGVGGVTTKEAKKRMFDAGASVVGVATLLGARGVRAFEDLAG